MDKKINKPPCVRELSELGECSKDKWIMSNITFLVTSSALPCILFSDLLPYQIETHEQERYALEEQEVEMHSLSRQETPS